MANNLKLGIIGFGNMGSRIGDRLKGTDGLEIIASRKQGIKGEGIEIINNNAELAKRSDVIILAIKQKDLVEISKEIAPYVKGKLVISLMAGITLEYLDQMLESRNSRIMTNVAFIDGAAISGYCIGKRCNAEDKKTIEKLLKYGSTQVLFINEDQMNILTVASSCSLGFLAETFDHFQKGFVKLGFDKTTARDLVNNSIQGTFVLSKHESFGQIAENVSSKGGLTAAGLTVLRNWRTDQIIENALDAAAKRGSEISETHTSAAKRENLNERRDIGNVNLIVVKIGTTNIVDDNFIVDIDRLTGFVDSIMNIKKMGKKVIIVTSGAVGSGSGRIGVGKAQSKVQFRKAAASVGQVVLMHAYEELFRKKGQAIGQILLTADDFKDKERFNNFIDTANALTHELDVIPIINENDVTTNEETTFNENDTLSAKIADGVKADILVILSDVDGLYTNDPKMGSAELINHVNEMDKAVSVAGGAMKGIGGMRSKMKAINMLLSKKIPVVIANGRKKHILENIIEGKEVGTLFT